MRQASVILTMALVALALPPLRAQQLKVEWLSGKRIDAVTVVAGSAVVRLCSTSRAEHCLVIASGSSGNCSRTVTGILCDAGGASLRGRKFFAQSAGPFRLVAALPGAEMSSPRSGATRYAIFSARSPGLRTVVSVDLETYIAGVLAGEAGILKSPQALRAMAVLARTWALEWRGRHRRDGFDYCSLTHCQAFRLPASDSDGPQDEIVRAVKETQGKVLRFHGLLIDAYFSADCGGMTEAAGNVWPDRAASYLVSVRDPYCAGDQHSDWERTIPLPVVATILKNDLGVSFSKPLADLRVDGRDASGRARTLRMVDGGVRLLDANQFRFAVNRRLGWNSLMSNLYNVERDGGRLIFTGRGLGHGVGLCQAGAEQMGRMGVGYEKILAAYFPGTEVANFPAASANDPILSSEHFALVFPLSQQPWAGQTLAALEGMRHELGSHAGPLPAKMRVETFATTEEFIRAAHEPGWAAGATDGAIIWLQPLGKLSAKGILMTTLRHELTHLAVHRIRGRGIPLWFEEGWVLYLTHEQVAADPHFDFGGRSLEMSVAAPRSEAEMKAAYLLALERVRNLARQHGEDAVWDFIEHPQSHVEWLKDVK